jgi:hypothetical protein
MMYQPSKLARKPEIVSRESGDSPWEGEMKHYQNRECILHSAEMLQVSSAKIMKLHIDEELLIEIKDKIARDLGIQDIITKL